MQALQLVTLTFMTGKRNKGNQEKYFLTIADWLVSPVPSKSKTSKVRLDATETASIAAIWSPVEQKAGRGEKSAVQLYQMHPLQEQPNVRGIRRHLNAESFSTLPQIMAPDAEFHSCSFIKKMLS